MNDTKTKFILSSALIAICFGLGGFFGGLKYQQSKTPARDGRGVAGMRTQQGGLVGTGRFGGNQAFRPIAGEVLSSDDKSITVKLADGSSKIVFLTTATPVTKSADGTKSDIVVGAKVGVFGTTNSDGSVTAQSIQLNPTVPQDR